MELSNKKSYGYQRESFILCWFLLGCIGLYYSRAILSIYTVGLFIIPLLVSFPAEIWEKYTRHTPTKLLTYIFLIYLISFLFSNNKDVWLIRLNTNLSFIFIPIGILFFGPYDKKLFHSLLYIFVSITSVSAILIGIDYLLNIQDYNELYKIAKTIPTPILHVRYSYYLAIAALLGVYLIIENSQILGKRSRSITIVLSIFLFISVHVLAVRSGILVLYSSLIAVFILYGFKTRSWKLLSLVFLTLMGSMYTSSKLLPSFQNKTAYMMWDLSRLNSIQDRHTYSDVIRLASIYAGLEVSREAPFFGVGIGDLPNEMDKKYTSLYADFPVGHRFNPISQYVYTLSAFGIIGFILFYFFLFYSFFNNGYKDYYLVLLFSGTMLLFIVECGIELQIGKTFFISLLCLGINRSN